MSSDYLKVAIFDGVSQDCDNFQCRVTPFAIENSEILVRPIKSVRKLTGHEDVKTVYQLSLDLGDAKYQFFPGDTIGVLPCNNETLVSKLLLRLNLESEADKACEIQILDGTLKKNPTIPKHLPPKTSLKNIFKNHVDIHSPPKKLFLKSLARFTQDPQERAILEQICSPKASKEYTQLITTSGKTLLGLLDTFPSCQPPVGVLLEHLPPLLPRPYSISSSPLTTTIEITFFVLVHEDGRKGVCTGWLESLIEDNEEHLVPFYFRQPTKFRLYNEPPIPIILIATGTGIAPFRGFLQYLEQQEERGEIWLFYGCRHHNKDFLFGDEIQEWNRKGIVSKLDLSFSRDGTQKNYVQHNIEKQGVEFADWVLKGAKIFVCGDAKTVVRDVRKTVDNLGKNVDELEKAGRFLVDAWT